MPFLRTELRWLQEIQWRTSHTSLIFGPEAKNLSKMEEDRENANLKKDSSQEQKGKK
jgi:hypothetical protein